MKESVLILVTCSSSEEAETIGNLLVAKRLAACVNVIPEIRSIFFWEGKISKEKEVLLIAKTRRELFDSVEKEVKRVHSYDLPEIIALPVVTGSKEYLEWIVRETQQ
jgi:periplasmic divalent cation tolerance protein